jgi:two-component system sensor histidine kinase HydH
MAPWSDHGYTGGFQDTNVQVDSIFRRSDMFHGQAAGVASALIVIGVLHYLTPLRFQHWHDVLQHLYFFPVVYAGFTIGWRGGLAAALFAAAVQAVHIRETWVPAHSYAGGQILEIPLFCVAGVLCGILVERERRQREQLARTTQQLNEVYLRLQHNFDEMKRAERLYAVGQLAAGLAHEIRNPLASIAGASGILRRNAHLEETHVRVLAVIDKECQRLTRLLSNFLDFARPRPPKFQTVDVGALLQPVVELATHAIGNQPVRINKELAKDLPSIDCDPDLLRQLLLNLIINGVQSMPSGGEVTVSFSLRSGKMCLRVSDEGVGISAENREKIFDPFFTTKEGGTGLGLSVAHQIVEQHGGVLTAEANPTKGMTFTTLLPLRHEVS